MAPTTARLPEFKRPPLVEAVLSVQFEKIEGFRTVQAGLFWDRLRSEFPHLEHVEEHPPIEQPLELPGPEGFRSSGVRVELVDTPVLPRLFFLTHPKTQLVQVQANRISHNWRKQAEGDQYVRYEQIRPNFERELRLLESFLADEKLGVLSPVQCEISYINHILPIGDGTSDIALSKVLRLWPESYQGTAGCDLEDVSVNLRHVIRGSAGEFLGRLLVSAKPAYRRSDNKPLLVLELVARGRPVGEGIQGALKFLDRGRELLRESFASITTDHMHQVWGRIDGR